MSPIYGGIFVVVALVLFFYFCEELFHVMVPGSIS